MRSTLRILPLFVVLSLLSGCFSSGPTRPAYDFSPFVNSDPQSVVVAPVASVPGLPGAAKPPELFLSTITVPLAERGYYVMPVRMTDTILRQSGFTPFQRELTTWSDFGTKQSGKLIVEPEQYNEAIGQEAVRLADFVGADAVLFVHITSWEHNIDISEGVFSNMIDDKMNHAVGLDYQLVDKNGTTLWRGQRHFGVSRGGGGFFKEVWNAAKSKPTDARLDALVARDINRVMVEGRRSKMKVASYGRGPALLAGPYHAGYEKQRAKLKPKPPAQPAAD